MGFKGTNKVTWEFLAQLLFSSNTFLNLMIISSCINRFVGNFGAIMFAPLGGYMIDAASTSRREVDFSPVIYTYLALKLMAAVMIFMVKLEFKPPGERMLANIKEITRNAEVVGFLIMMMFAGTFWGYIEAFLFW